MEQLIQPPPPPRKAWRCPSTLSDCLFLLHCSACSEHMSGLTVNVYMLVCRSMSGCQELQCKTEGPDNAGVAWKQKSPNPQRVSTRPLLHLQSAKSKNEILLCRLPNPPPPSTPPFPALQQHTGQTKAAQLKLTLMIHQSFAWALPRCQQGGRCCYRKSPQGRQCSCNSRNAE